MAEDGGFSSQISFNFIMGHVCVLQFHRLLLTVFILFAIKFKIEEL